MSRKKKEHVSRTESGPTVETGTAEERSVQEPGGAEETWRKKRKISRKELEEHLQRAERELESYRDNLQRLQAEFENFKKRQIKERDENRRAANETVLKAFLPILDNLERAVEHGKNASEPGKLLEGVELVLRQFRESLLQFGIEAIEAQGAEFDPHVHEAMSRVETEGDPPDNTVVEVYQKGYLLHGRVLRPALVGVAKLVDEGGEEEQG